jgi:hypothetical protein
MVVLYLVLLRDFGMSAGSAVAFVFGKAVAVEVRALLHEMSH